jgi:metallo-beta-lactamase class B
MRVRFPSLLQSIVSVVVLLAACAVWGRSQNADWTTPFPPHKVMGNVYYVGSKDLAAFLIVTPEGNILINSNLESSVPQIKASVEKLGFKFSDTKMLQISHAHYDHDAGSATVKRLTGAKYMVMDADVQVVEDGGKSDFIYGQKENWYKPAKVDRVLHDGDEVKLGGTVLVAHKTAGHTKGCTTWTMKVADGGKTYDVVIVGSPNVNTGYRLVGKESYPGIADDFQHGFEVLRGLHCDVFLGAHGQYYGLAAKYARLKAGDREAFVDPAGYQAYVLDRESAFREELVRQRKQAEASGNGPAKP